MLQYLLGKLKDIAARITDLFLFVLTPVRLPSGGWVLRYLFGRDTWLIAVEVRSARPSVDVAAMWYPTTLTTPSSPRPSGY